MNATELRILELHALILSREALLRGMESDNRQRERNDFAHAWSGDMLIDMGNELEEYAKELAEIRKHMPETQEEPR